MQPYRMITKLVLTVFPIWLITTAYSNTDSLRTNHYAIYKNGKVIGRLLAESRQTATGQKLVLNSKINTSLIIDLQVNSITENILKEGYLLSAQSERKINGRQTMNHGIQYNKGTYTLKGKGADPLNLQDKIKFTTSLMYFSEPIGFSTIYSEAHKKMVSVVKKANGSYRVTLPDGNYSDFHYSVSGSLFKVICKTDFGEITFLRE